MGFTSSFFTCCGLLSKKSDNEDAGVQVAKGGLSCTNNGQQALIDSSSTTIEHLNDSNFGVISPDNSLLQVKLEPPNTPQTPESIAVEPSAVVEVVNSIDADESIGALGPATVVANNRPKKKGKKKILRRIMTLSTSKKRSKLVNVSSMEN